LAQFQALRSLWSAAETVWQRLAALPVLRQDALLYLGSGVLSAGTLAMAVSNDYREWAAATIGPYLLAAVLCEAVARHRLRAGSRAPALVSGSAVSPAGEALPQGGRVVTASASGGVLPGRRPTASPAVSAAWALEWLRASFSRLRRGSGDRVRAGVIVGLLVFAVFLPLSMQLLFRAQGGNGAHAQPEVAVIERAGDRAMHAHDIYPANPTSPGSSPRTDSHGLDATAFFPYLPAMAVFGLTNALHIPAALADARVALTGFTLLVVIVALALVSTEPERRWRAFQVLVVLPTGSLLFVTGGDDLPVLALMLLSLVLAIRRQPYLSGIAMGLAATLKFSAWGLLVLLAFGIQDREGRPAYGRYGFAALVMVLPIVGAGIVLGPHSFVLNVIEFPLGLAPVHSPAQSPLPGQELVQLLPRIKTPLTAALVGGAGIAILAALVKWKPRSPEAIARFTGLAIVGLMLVAPASRFGYLIYPVNLLVWAYLLRQGKSPATDLVRPGQLASPTW